MGDAIAHQLLAAGFAVRVWNRTRGRTAAIVAAGATAAQTAADAVAEADLVLTMLTDGMATASVIAPAGGEGLEAMPRGCTWIQMWFPRVRPSWDQASERFRKLSKQRRAELNHCAGPELLE
jgi:3-hydroxyisobutyrate dehydrogenase-like beta-hydroxyacid dehydrogenase